MHDNYLWQLVDFPTRNENVLDLIQSNPPKKVKEIHGFEDIISTDHKLMSFTVDFNIPKKNKVKRNVFDHKKADWNALNEALVQIPWDLAFSYIDVSRWCDLFLTTVKDHVPMRQVRPSSLLCILSKVLERCVVTTALPTPPKSFTIYSMVRFRPGRLTESQLLVVYHDLLNIVASGKEIDAIYLDLSKAFDKVPHHLLLAKLSKYGISGSLHLWFQSYLSNRYQRVAMEGVTSYWLSISSGVPQGSIPGPFLFVFFVNDLPDYIQ